MASPKDLLMALSRAYTLTKTKPSDDAQLEEALKTVGELHESLGWVVVRCEADGFSVNSELVGQDDGELEGLKEAFSAARISELRMQEPVTPGDLEDFVRRLTPGAVPGDQPGLIRFRGLVEVLGLSFTPAPQGVLGMAGSIQSLFSGPNPAGAGGAGSDQEEGSESGWEGDETSEVGRLLAAYFSASGTEKTQAAEAIAAASARLAEARDLGSVADLVEGLCDGSNMGQKDPDAVTLARRLASPQVANHLVGRLGSSRDEEERSHLIQVSSRLGREMALALADALGEARDRFQRRAFMDAMVAQGEVAREMAESMVEDPRWYVVRNGVSLLGELGGDGAVSHLTSTLANEDARVRRETVVALAKLGGEDAGQLLLGMLDDQEADIRAKACTAVGVLKVEKALKPLMKLLDGDKDPEVQVQSLHALGQLGDPGAVPLIEKKAVPRFLSRPSKELRMAGYRALAGIGTPHALDLLRKAKKDSDREVRKLVHALMD